MAKTLAKMPGGMALLMRWPTVISESRGMPQWKFQIGDLVLVRHAYAKVANRLLFSVVGTICGRGTLGGNYANPIYQIDVAKEWFSERQIEIFVPDSLMQWEEQWDLMLVI